MARCTAAALLAAASAAATATMASAAGAPPPPNIIIFNPDEMRAESMGVYGHPVTRTPAFSRLAASGTLFTHAFSTYPVCTQSRASFLTGRFTHSAGHRTLYDPLRFFEPNLLRYAKQAGYHVMWAGKNDALDLPSFNSSVSVASGSFGGGGRANAGPNPYNASDPRFYSFLTAPPAFPPNATLDAGNVDAAIDFLRARHASGSAQPFFLYLPLTAPHPPYGCPEPFYSMYSNASGQLPPLRPAGLPGKPDFHARIRHFRNITSWPDEASTLAHLHSLYLGCISFSDSLLGALLDELEALGLEESTAVVVLSDHGDYGGDYGLVEKWPSGLEDVLTRVPLIMRVPGGLQGQVVDSLVQHMDITPTLLAVMNVTAQHVHHAVNQLPVLLGQAEPDASRLAFAEGGYSTAEPKDFEGDCSDPLKAGDCNASSIYYPKAYQEWHEPLTVCRAAMVRSTTHKLVRRSDPLDADHDSELYDLGADPLELVNQYSNASYSAVRAQLAEAMLTWMLQTSDVVPLMYDGAEAPYELPRTMPAGNWSAARDDSDGGG